MPERRAGRTRGKSDPIVALAIARADIHEAFLAIGCCIVCYRRLKNTSLLKELLEAD